MEVTVIPILIAELGKKVMNAWLRDEKTCKSEANRDHLN